MNAVHGAVPAPGSQRAHSEKRRVALTSLLAAVALTGMKLVVGIKTGSLGILSEAAHSGLDLVAAAVTLYAIRAAARPADRDHMYGHGKIENLSALFETFLLFITCIWIVYEAFQRLFYKHVEVDANIWAFLTVGISIVIDWSRSRALTRVARRYESQALEADALHFSTDIWSSTVVLVGLVLVRLASLGGPHWLIRADAGAALGVAAIVIWISIRLGRRTIDDLLDRISPALHDEVVAAAQVPGVLAVERVRMRRSGPELFVDLTLSADRNASLEEAHEVATRAEDAIRRVRPGADVVVHIDPGGSEQEGIVPRVRSSAARFGFVAHNIRIHEVRGKYSLELHLETSQAATVGEAHRRASEFEDEMRRAFPVLDRVSSHIEPTADASVIEPASPADKERVTDALRAICADMGHPFHAYDVGVLITGGKLSTSFRCMLDGSASLTAAHGMTEEIESRLRARIPELGRVVIRIEPPEHT